MKWDRIKLSVLGFLSLFTLFSYMSIVMPPMLNTNDTFINYFGVVLFLIFGGTCAYIGKFIFSKWN